MKRDDVRATEIENFYKTAIEQIKAEVRGFIEYDEDGKILKDYIPVCLVEKIIDKHIGI